MTITALPTPPSRSDPSNFAAAGDAFLGALPTFVSEANALAADVNADTLTASAAATAAVAASGASIWVSGTTYAIGDCRFSPVDHQTYRRKTSGAGTTDPSLDGTNWARLGIDRPWTVKTSAYTAVSGDRILADTNSAAWTLTLPASPAVGDSVRVIDMAGTFATNNLTVDRNSLKIMNLLENMTVSTNNAAFELVYSGATYGWRLA